MTTNVAISARIAARTQDANYDLQKADFKAILKLMKARAFSNQTDMTPIRREALLNLVKNGTAMKSAISELIYCEGHSRILGWNSSLCYPAGYQDELREYGLLYNSASKVLDSLTHPERNQLDRNMEVFQTTAKKISETLTPTGFDRFTAVVHAFKSAVFIAAGVALLSALIVPSVGLAMGLAGLGIVKTALVAIAGAYTTMWGAASLAASTKILTGGYAKKISLFRESLEKQTQPFVAENRAQGPSATP